MVFVMVCILELAEDFAVADCYLFSFRYKIFRWYFANECFCSFLTDEF